jgi:cell division protein FtsB
VSPAAPRWRRWASRLVLAVALAAGLAYLPYRLRDGGPGAEQLADDLARTRTETARLRAENARYAREIEALESDPQAIEDLARNDLGMVRDGELIIRLDGLSNPLTLAGLRQAPARSAGAESKAQEAPR